MNHSPRRERRSPLVVILDAMLGLAATLQSGQLPRPRRARAGAGAGVAWVVAGVLAAAAGTAILVLALMRAPGGLSALPPAATRPAPPPSSAPGQTDPTGAGPSVTPSPSPTSAAPGRTSAGATSAPPVTVVRPLTARYADAGGTPGLLGYRATVTIANPGSRARTGWRLTVTLPRPTLRVSNVSGAVARQDGSTWTFVPDQSTERISPGGAAEIAFEVRGATLVDAAPQDCRIDGNPCAGIAE